VSNNFNEMSISIVSVIKGLASYVLPKSMIGVTGTGGSNSAEYCYSVWLRHLYCLQEKGIIKTVDSIENVAELGPGDSLGIGICSLYTGAKKYYAFDVIKHSNIKHNKYINEEVGKLFEQKTDIPSGSISKNVKPVISNYKFPSSLLPFDAGYYNERRGYIDKALDNQTDSPVHISYVVPWMKSNNLDVPQIDLVFSQAVMEHVIDIDFTYKQMYDWLKPGGIISHQIDFKAHEISKKWNEHWFISESLWKVLMHGRKYAINRLPLSAHIKAIEKAGFIIKNVVPFNQKNEFEGKKPLVPGVAFDEQDFCTSSALIQAVKM